MSKYSYSRLSTFDNCALQYKFAYIDKLEKDYENSIEAYMGKKVHDTLEEFYRQLKYSVVWSLEELLQYYKKIWKEGFSKDIKVVRCHLKAQNYFDMGEKYLTDYYNHYKPFDQDYTLGLELAIDIDLEGDGRFVLNGRIDRLGVKNDTYIIHDYKTGATLPKSDDVDENIQLGIYAMAIREMYKDVKKVELVWHYLAFDKEIKVVNEEKDSAKLKKELAKKIEYLEGLSTEDFKPRESALCEWCVYASQCPVKAHIVKTKQMSIAEFQEDYGVKLVDEYIKLQEQRDKLNSELNLLTEKVFEYGKRENVLTVAGSLGKLRLYNYTSYTLPTKGTPKYEALKKVLKDGGQESLFKIDDYFLSKMIGNKDLPEGLAEKVLAFVEKKEGKKIYVNNTKD